MDVGTVAPPLQAPTERELASWRLLLRLHAHISRRLEAELVAEHNLTLAEYDVLLQLAEAPDRRLRMTELADRVLLSRSGLTRLVDRMERSGLVERAACASDARGTFTVLTPAGLARLRAAAPTHLRGISEHLIHHLDPAELDALAALLTKLLVAAGGDASPPESGSCGTGQLDT